MQSQGDTAEQWEKGNPFSKWYWIILILTWKKWILTLTHTTYQFIPGKTVDLNVKDIAVKLLEENIKHLYDPEAGKGFLRQTRIERIVNTMAYFCPMLHFTFLSFCFRCVATIFFNPIPWSLSFTSEFSSFNLVEF